VRGLVVIAALALAGCGHLSSRPVSVVEPVICPAQATAAAEAAPARPALTLEQLQALDVATLTALGEDLGLAWIRVTGAEEPAWAGRQTARIEAMRVWCEEQSG